MNTAMPVIFAGGARRYHSGFSHPAGRPRRPLEAVEQHPRSAGSQRRPVAPWRRKDRLRAGRHALGRHQLPATHPGKAWRGRLGEAELFLTASHTHCAPNIDDHLPDMGTIYEDYSVEVRQDRRALGTRPCRSWPAERFATGESPTAHAVNRRAWCLRPVLAMPPWKCVMARHPNPRGAARRRAAGVRHHGGKFPSRCWPGCWEFRLPSGHHFRPPRGFGRLSGRMLRQALRQARADIPAVFSARLRRRPAAQPRLAGCRCRPTTCCIASSIGPVFWPFTPAAASRGLPR